MPLTDAVLKAAKPRQKPYKLTDGQGLYVSVQPTGRLWWRFKYMYHGREKLISLGTYPEVPLRVARQRREEARRQVADKADPSALRRAEKVTPDRTFKGVAESWLALRTQKVGAKSLARTRGRLTTWIYPIIGREAIATIEPPAVLEALRRIESRGRHDTAHRARAECGLVFRFAVASGLATRDPTIDLRGALAPIQTEHFAAVTDPTEVGGLLRAIWGYSGQPVVEIALRLLPYLFCRPGELRAAEWAEVDLDAAEWRIPAEKMKMRRAHIVPLAKQAVALLRDLDTHSGGGRLLFPQSSDASRPMSDNTLNACLRRLGYTSQQMTAHGFRSMASTLLNEQGLHPDLIELQLAHKSGNETRAIYNRAARLTERREMMQGYADLLDQLRDGRKVNSLGVGKT